MNTTIFLAQIWGPVLLALGIGFFISKSFYVKLYKNIQTEPLATLGFGMASMVAGLLHVFMHSVWGSFNEGLISVLGWATLIKGVGFVIIPRTVDKAADWEAAQKLVPVAGAVLLIVGAYVSWIGYLA